MLKIAGNQITITRGNSATGFAATANATGSSHVRPIILFG